MSCLEPRQVPQPQLPDSESQKKTLEAIGTLTASEFLSKKNEGQHLNMHRLVHLATRHWLKDEDLLVYWGKKHSRCY